MISSSSSSSSSSAARPRSDVDHLPEELMVLILAKCPVKSLVRFKSVSKSWQSIICDGRFSKSHHGIQGSRVVGDENEKRFIILGKGWKLGGRIYVVRLEGEYNILGATPRYFSKGIFRTELVLPYPSPIFNIPLCSCDGLILFSQNNTTTTTNTPKHFMYKFMYMLWNPSARKHSIITGPRAHPHHRPWLDHSFYYDPTTDDHMILFSDKKYSYTSYSCNKGNWSDIEDFPGELLVSITDPSSSPSPSKGEVVCVDGCFYSINLESGEIVCFDTRDGKLHKFGQPNDVEGVGRLYALASERRLCLYGNMKDVDRKSWFRRWEMEKNNNDGRFEKWVMDNSVSVSRKLIGMENEPEEVADLWLQVHNNATSVHANNSFHPSERSRIFPYSENLYMHDH